MRWRADWRVRAPGSGSAEQAWLSCTHVDRGGGPLPLASNKTRAQKHTDTRNSVVGVGGRCAARGLCPCLRLRRGLRRGKQKCWGCCVGCLAAWLAGWQVAFTGWVGWLVGGVGCLNVYEYVYVYVYQLNPSFLPYNPSPPHPYPLYPLPPPPNTPNYTKMRKNGK